MTTRLIPVKETASRVGLSKSSLYRREVQGKFPRRIRISYNRSAYVESEVEDWLQSKIAERQ